MCMSAMPHCQKGCDSAVPSYPTEVAENPLSPGAKDSGYSSDTERFDSPISQMTSVDEGISLDEYKAQVDEAYREYFLSNNVMELIHLIRELDAPLFGYVAVMRAISLSLDRGDKERELVSRFFAVGHGIALSSFALEKGFEKTFERIEDLKLDCLSVETYLSRFLARAIVDEVFPPRILQNPLLKTYGASVLRETEELLSLPHSLERMEHVWGAGAASLEELQVMKRLVRDAIEEFFMSHDVEECLRCIQELHAMYFMHEFVKKTVEIAMDGDAKRRQLAVALLKEAVKRDVVTHHQLVLGLSRLEKSLDQLQLDVPHAKIHLKEMEDSLLS